MSQQNCLEENCSTSCSCGCEEHQQPKIEELFKDVKPTEEQYVVYAETTETSKSIDQINKIKDLDIFKNLPEHQHKEALEHLNTEIKRIERGEYISRILPTAISAQNMEELRELMLQAKTKYEDAGFSVKFSDVLHVVSQSNIIKQ